MLERWLLVGDTASPHVRRLAEGLSAAGLDVHVSGFGVTVPGVETHLLRPNGPGDGRYVAAAPALARIIRRLRPRVVNAHYLSSYGVLAALTRSSNLVQTTWGSDILLTARRPGRRELAQWALRRAVLVTGDSKSLLDGVADLAPDVPRHRFVFGPPQSAFVSNCRKPIDIVVSARNHEPLYRIERIIEAWNLAGQRLPHHRLIVAGSGSRTPQLRKLAGRAVEFVGSLPHSEMLQLLGEARLSVSIPDSDATSATVLESLAAGCPVIASDVPANREWLEAAHLVPIDPPPRTLANAIVRRVGVPASLDLTWSFESQLRGMIEAAEAALRSPVSESGL